MVPTKRDRGIPIRPPRGGRDGAAHSLLPVGGGTRGNQIGQLGAMLFQSTLPM